MATDSTWTLTVLLRARSESGTRERKRGTFLSASSHDNSGKNVVAKRHPYKQKPEP